MSRRVPTPETWDTPLLPPLTPSGGHHTWGRYTSYWNAVFSFHNSYGKPDQSKDMRNYRKASLFDEETKSWEMCARQIKIWLKGEHGIIGGELKGRINGRSDLQKKTRMHSSRMRTARSSSRPGGGSPPGRPSRDQAPPAVDRITDACENITLPQLRCGR